MNINDCLKNIIKPDGRYAILGVGSIMNSDDAAGTYLIELLSEMIKQDNVLLVAGSTAPENFTGVIKDFRPDVLFIVDAAYMGISPGEIRIVPACDIGGISFSTHMLPLTVMLKYLESESGCDVMFLGIQPRCTDYGFNMCDDVIKGVKQLAGAFCSALNRRS